MSEENVPFPGKLKIFSGPANPDLAQKIASCLNQSLGEVSLGRFSDGEFHAEYDESIRGADVFIIQSTNQPDGHLFELLDMIYAAVGASAGRVTAVIPYFGYARQDRKPKARAAIAAKLVADLITTAGADRVLLMDLHAAQIQGFFKQKETVPDHIFAKPILINFLLNQYKENLAKGSVVIVAPDIGAIKIGRPYAKMIYNIPLAIIDKRRPAPNVTEILTLIGDVKDKEILMIDDIVDTGGTIIRSAETLVELGAKKIDVLCVHPVLSGQAVENLKNSPISNIFVTDTIAIPAQKLAEKIKVISVAPLFAEAIKEIHDQGSVSKHFVD